MASVWGIFISVLNYVLVILLCLYSNLGVYAIPVAALISGVFSHLTFTPLYAAYCLNEKRWYFFIKMIKGLAGFIFLLLLAYCWKRLDLFTIDSWLTFLTNSLIIGLILLVVSLLMKFEHSELYEGYKKIKERITR